MRIPVGIVVALWLSAGAGAGGTTTYEDSRDDIAPNFPGWPILAANCPRTDILAATLTNWDGWTHLVLTLQDLRGSCPAADLPGNVPVIYEMYFQTPVWNYGHVFVELWPDGGYDAWVALHDNRIGGVEIGMEPEVGWEAGTIGYWIPANPPFSNITVHSKMRPCAIGSCAFSAFTYADRLPDSGYLTFEG